MYIVVSVVIVFFMKLENRRKRTLGLWNTVTVVQYPLFEKHKGSGRINANISKYIKFAESMVLVFNTKSNMTSKYG